MHEFRSDPLGHRFRKKRIGHDLRTDPRNTAACARKWYLPAFLRGYLTLIVVLLAGCSALTREAPVRQTFLLETPPLSAVERPQPGALRVGNINVAAPFRGKAFVYRMSELRFETDFYVEFLVPPAAMLTEQTARALDRAKPFARIAGPGATADAEWVLDGFVSALYADAREAGKPAAELAVTYYLTPAGGAQQTPIWSHDYRQHVPMRDASANAYAEALNKAFADIIAELARDLAAVQLPK
jgi:cholesterol transport system auxiliary component